MEAQIPRSTLYRVAKDLCSRRWLIHRRARGYRTTQRGIQALQEDKAQVGTLEEGRSAEKVQLREEKRQRMPKKPPVDLPAIQKLLELSDKRVNFFLTLHPPLRKVPTPTHQAMIELLWAEICDRSWPEMEGHHLNFLNLGGTFTWKTSAGEFCAYMVAGKDITPYIIEMSREGGYSLWIRKTATGEIIFKREILERFYVCLDDYHRADRQGKEAASHLLTGRTQIPVDNEIQAIRCTVMVNLNPKKEGTIFDKTGFDGPLIRRFVPCDLDVVELPKLKEIGQEPLDEAKNFGPLEMKKPTSSCKKYRQELISYSERLLIEEVQRHYVDIDGLLNIARGFTGYGFTPSEAVRYVLYRASLPYHTLGWLRPKWIQGFREKKPPAKIKKSVTSKVETGEAKVQPVERLRFSAKKREQTQQIEELTRKLKNFDSPTCNTLRQNLADLKEAIERATSQQELDGLISYQKSSLEPCFEEAVKEYKKGELHKFVQKNAGELEKLLRCVELLDLDERPEDIENILESIECIRKAPGGLIWVTLDGEEHFPGFITWVTGRELLWTRIQRARKFLEKVFPVLPQEKAEKLKRGLDPVKILHHKWVSYNPPKSTHIITVSNSIGCNFETEITLIFKDKDGMVLKRNKHSLFPSTIHPGKQEVRVDLGIVNPAPNDVSYCELEITRLKPTL